MMKRFAAKNLVLFLAVAMAAGCSSTNSTTGPASVAEKSTAKAALADRVRFVEQYVTFRRKYEKLEYDMTYQNNGGGMAPGPSDWDIRLLAVVPKAEVALWIPAGVKQQKQAQPKWLRDLPGDIPKNGVVEWYRQAGTEVGIDRSRSIIAYRNTTNPDFR